MSGCAKSSFDGYRSYDCLRPVKEEGLCAQHLAGKRRADRNTAERMARYERRAENRSSMCRLADRLSGALRIHCGYNDYGILISRGEAEAYLAAAEGRGV